MIHLWRHGFKSHSRWSSFKTYKISFLIEETLVNAEVSCISSSSVFYWPENLLLLTNKLVYQSVENKKWSLENKKWLPLKLEAKDNNCFPTASLFSIRTKKRQEKSNNITLLEVRYSSLSNKRAAQFIIFLKNSNLHGLIPSCTFY